MRVGLRVDVDTFRGTRLGVPKLCRLLATARIRASFFLSIGPDNMGRHLWRLLDPSFLWKMLRSNAPGLYGWEIVLRGTIWPGPRIGERLAPVIQELAGHGHEIGLHAWDHHAWQVKIGRWQRDRLAAEISRAMAALTGILGQEPVCSAAPAWRCTGTALQVKEQYPFKFNSDCRGSSVFLPVVSESGQALRQPQVPVTLPTYDELVGRDGITAAGYYEHLLTLLRPGRLNVLTVHAEVEGMSRLAELECLLNRASQQGWSFVPLGELLDEHSSLPSCRMVRGSVPGRAGWLSCQAS